MDRQERIKRILAEAERQILDVLNEKDRPIEEVYKSIDETANKILFDGFNARTLLLEPHNIDEERYGMLEYMSFEDVDNLFNSCFKWYIDREVDGSDYVKFCNDLSIVLSTSLEEELEKNIDTIIYKHQQFNN